MSGHYSERGWVPGTPIAPRCRCSHLRGDHYRDRRGKTVCSSAACGCAEFRPHEDRPAGAA